jgi:hypothetical protein
MLSPTATGVDLMGRANRVVAGCLALAGVASTSACFMDMGDFRVVSTTAVFLEDGEPAALFHWCTGDGVWSVTVYDRTSGDRRGDDIPFWIVGGSPETAVDELRLLQRPAGWEALGHDPDANPINEFVDGHTYTVKGEGDNLEGTDYDLLSYPVTFTLDDLEALPGDKVWAPPAVQEDERAMSRDEFFQAAEQSCQDLVRW